MLTSELFCSLGYSCWCACENLGSENIRLGSGAFKFWGCHFIHSRA